MICCKIRFKKKNYTAVSRLNHIYLGTMLILIFHKILDIKQGLET